MHKGQIILFQTQGGRTKIEVQRANESGLLAADQMAEVFQGNKPTFPKYKNVYDKVFMIDIKTPITLRNTKILTSKDYRTSTTSYITNDSRSDGTSDGTK